MPYFAFSMLVVLIIDKHLRIGALQCLVPWKIRLLAHFPWQMLQFGKSNGLRPLRIANPCFRRMDIVAIASSQHLSNMFSHFSSLSPLTSLESTDLKSERTCFTQGTALLQSGDAYL